MSTLDTSPKRAGRAHLSAPAVIVIGDFDCGRIEEIKGVDGPLYSIEIIPQSSDGEGARATLGINRCK